MLAHLKAIVVATGALALLGAVQGLSASVPGAADAQEKPAFSPAVCALAGSVDPSFCISLAVPMARFPQD
jgi:hypothetical protein